MELDKPSPLLLTSRSRNYFFKMYFRMVGIFNGVLSHTQNMERKGLKILSNEERKILEEIKELFKSLTDERKEQWRRMKLTEENLVKRTGTKDIMQRGREPRLSRTWGIPSVRHQGQPVEY